MRDHSETQIETQPDRVRPHGLVLSRPRGLPSAGMGPHGTGSPNAGLGAGHQGSTDHGGPVLKMKLRRSP